MTGDFLHLVWTLVDSVGQIDDGPALDAADALRPMLERVEETALRISPVSEIGAYRPLCTTTIRVAAGLKTHEAKRQAYKRDRLGVPITQCAARADFLVNGAPTCRTHAAAAALAHILERKEV